MFHLSNLGTPECTVGSGGPRFGTNFLFFFFFQWASVLSLGDTALNDKLAWGNAGILSFEFSFCSVLCQFLTIVPVQGNTPELLFWDSVQTPYNPMGFSSAGEVGITSQTNQSLNSLDFIMSKPLKSSGTWCCGHACVHVLATGVRLQRRQSSWCFGIALRESARLGASNPSKFNFPVEFNRKGFQL